jgi:microcystin-dependent protein
MIPAASTGNPVTDTVHGTPRIAYETRPHNIAVMWCIKAWNAPVNQGNIDVAALVKELAALKSAHPVGAIIPFPKAEVPPGYLELNGSVQSIAAYPDLAAYLGTTFNKGDEGAGNFRLPESRGEFLRGWDHGRGVDAGRTMGSYQLDALQDIKGVYAASFGVQLAAATPAPTGAFQGVVSATTLPGGGASTGIASMSFDASRVARTAAETRSRNLAVIWCIKAWNAPVNQGNIDIAALAPLASQATETNQGTVKVASDAQMLDGNNDGVVVTPKRLRKGFAINLAQNGYIAFPSWLGGLIIQWTTGVGVATEGAQTIAYPMAFPNEVFFRVVSSHAASATAYANSAYQTIGTPGLTSSEVYLQAYANSDSTLIYPKLVAIGR